MRAAIPWLLSALIVSALVSVVPFDTIDARWTTRVKTAPEVWSVVAPRLQRLQAGFPLAAIYSGALLLTLAGAFALIWTTRSAAAGARATSSGSSRSDYASVWTACSRALRLAATHEARSAISRRTCVIAMAVLGLIVAWRLGAFVFVSRLTGLPDGFASIDHPFHVAREELLRRSLLSGEFLRWIAPHQGGYPAEFYPLGFAYGVVALWGLLFGTLAIPVVHKLAVIALFLVPAFVYPALARRDGWPPLVGLVGFIFHVSLPGGYWHGGYSELVFMGLVANVSAGVAVLVALVWLLDALSGRSRRAIAWAALAAAAAIWCNPRSAIGLVACAVGAWMAVALRSRTWSGIRSASLRLAGIAALAALLAAPELVSLLRFSDLYYFIHYTFYGTSADYLGSTIEAVSLPVFPLFLAGLVIAFFVPPERMATRAVAFSLLVHIGFTLFFTFGGDLSQIVQQLESTRLMTVQRYLMIYLAAVGLHAVAVIIATHAMRVRVRPDWIQVGVVFVLLLAWLTPSALVPIHVSPPGKLARSSLPEMKKFEDAVRSAAALAAPGTAILVTGTTLSAHQQLWAPLVSDRLFYYDNWMWYWHTRHAGPYDPRVGSAYDPKRMDEVFSCDYFRANGIGAVVATGQVDVEAMIAAGLRPIWIGTSSTYVVPDPWPLATIGERGPDSLTMTNHRIEVRDRNGSGDLVIRQNWFPRWRAEVNGRPVAIEQTANGYMRVALPGGPVDVIVTYSLQPQDVAARGAGVLGLVLAGAVLFRRTKTVSPSSQTV